jgi:hypothetical protein
MVFSGGEIAAATLDLNTVNNSDRLGDVTAEPFTAPSPDPEKFPNAVTLRTVVLDRCCGGGRMCMQTGAQPEQISGHSYQ